MPNKITEDLDMLIAREVIDEQTAERLRHFYADREEESKNRQYVIFGILGSLLIGLGLILIIAHNWDSLSRLIKTTLAFAPLIASQGLVIYTILYKRDDRAWRESSATLVILALGGCISLISQIYNIPGNISTFMISWMLLSLPLIYLIPSTMACALYLIGITYYAIETGYWAQYTTNANVYWLMLLAILPYYISLLRNYAKSNFTYLINWMIPISIVICLGIIGDENWGWLLIAYMNLLGLFYLVGKYFPLFKNQWHNNGYRAIGSVGTIVLLLIMSFRGTWQGSSETSLPFDSQEFVVAMLLFIVALYMLYKVSVQQRPSILHDPTSLVFIAFTFIYICLRFYPVLSTILINAMVFLIGLRIVFKAMNSQNLGLLNYGLLTITALIICRFFDTNISFIIRGLLFVILGVGFFLSNLRLIKRSS